MTAARALPRPLDLYKTRPLETCQLLAQRAFAVRRCAHTGKALARKLFASRADCVRRCGVIAL